MKKIYALLFISLLSTTINAQWNQLGIDIDGEAANDFSGSSVDLSSDSLTIVIGARSNTGNGINAGHARVFKSIGGTWIQQGGDIDGEAAGDQSGVSVSISADGSTVAIGAFENDGNGTFSGHVRVYKFISGVWTQQGSDIDGENAFDFSGESVQLSADGLTIAIGADGNDGNGVDAGHVRVYQFISGAWTQLGGDIDGEASNDNSGFSVSLSSDSLVVAIGAFGNDGNGVNAGHVRVYKLVGGVWTQQGGDIDGEAANDFSGFSVSLSSDGLTVAIGAPTNSGSGFRAGHVRIYKFSRGVWTQQGGDIDGEAANDFSGYSVDLSSDGLTVAIGATGNTGNGQDAGHARVYSLIGGVWIQLGSDFDSEAANDFSGFSVSLSSNGLTLAIGALENDGNGPNAGHARVYSMSSVVGILEVNSLFKDVSVFPNPNKGIVNINLGNLNKASVRVFSISGKLIYQKMNISESIFKFELKEASGIYFIEIITREQSQHYPLIIE
ncbi:MAG: T9SS type A sorting domain-containing protein [Flavobacteriales bacterium]|nr:T9SS type A sorting domain-containing protein [Flavobacteriales bacterium]